MKKTSTATVSPVKISKDILKKIKLHAVTTDQTITAVVEEALMEYINKLSKSQNKE